MAIFTLKPIFKKVKFESPIKRVVFSFFNESFSIEPSEDYPNYDLSSFTEFSCRPLSSYFETFESYDLNDWFFLMPGTSCLSSGELVDYDYFAFDTFERYLTGSPVFNLNIQTNRGFIDSGFVFDYNFSVVDTFFSIPTGTSYASVSNAFLNPLSVSFLIDFDVFDVSTFNSLEITSFEGFYPENLVYLSSFNVLFYIDTARDFDTFFNYLTGQSTEFANHLTGYASLFGMGSAVNYV